jgi:hypothetical protein
MARENAARARAGVKKKTPNQPAQGPIRRRAEKARGSAERRDGRNST